MKSLYTFLMVAAIGTIYLFKPSPLTARGHIEYGVDDMQGSGCVIDCDCEDAGEGEICNCVYHCTNDCECIDP